MTRSCVRHTALDDLTRRGTRCAAHPCGWLRTCLCISTPDVSSRLPESQSGGTENLRFPTTCQTSTNNFISGTPPTCSELFTQTPRRSNACDSAQRASSRSKLGRSPLAMLKTLNSTNGAAAKKHTQRWVIVQRLHLLHHTFHITP